MIDIIPHCKIPKLKLISCTIPAMKPMQKNKVPVWLAKLLQKKNKCTILAPQDFDTIDLQAEQTLDTFSKVPFYMYELQDLDFKFDKQILQDLRDCRNYKIGLGLGSVDSCLQTNNITSLEICEIKPLITASADLLQSFK